MNAPPNTAVERKRPSVMKTKEEIMSSLEEMTAKLIFETAAIPEDVRHSGPNHPEEVEIFFEAAPDKDPEVGWMVTGGVTDDDRCVSRICIWATYHEFGEYLQTHEWAQQLGEIADDMLLRQASGHY